MALVGAVRVAQNIHRMEVLDVWKNLDFFEKIISSFTKICPILSMQIVFEEAFWEP